MLLATKLRFKLQPLLFVLLIVILVTLVITRRHARAPQPVLSMDQQSVDLRRVPHNMIRTQQVIFSAKAQDNRAETAINFEYQTSPSVPPAYLRIKENGQPVRLALVSHPLLDTLDWASSSDPQGVQLFERDMQYGTVTNVLEAKLAAPSIAADSVAAAKLNLTPVQYTSLDSLTSLTGITAILTSYSKPTKDGGWSMFHGTYDLTNADTTTSGEIQGSIQFISAEVTHAPFLLSPVHVDYREPFKRP